MSLGKKSIAGPEVGDKVVAKIASVTVYEDDNGSNAITTAPKNANLGTIEAITASNDNGDTMYQVADGWVYADDVTTSVNSNYNYPGDAPITATNTTQDTKTTGPGIWAAINTFLGGIFGVLNKKKTATATTDGTSDTTDTNTDPTTTPVKKTTPTWVYFTIGGVVLGGIVLALVWPKKKPETTAKPIVLK